MASRLADGSIQMSDGRIIYANSLIQAQDLLEILPLVTPPPAWPFVSGGGGGGGSGTPGARGANGVPGAPGAPGTQGPQGTNPGLQGPQGAGGGAQGRQGPQGLLGPQGDAGLNGAQGRQGPQGNQGAVGSGIQGPQGNGGVQGNQGNVGAGTQGPQGNQGFQGTNPGPQGNQGDLGTQGAQGPQGSGSGSSNFTLIQSQTLLADTDTVDFLGLNGEFDGYYYLDLTTIKGVAGSVSGDIQPNAITTQQLTQSLVFGTGLGPTQGSATTMSFYGSGGNVGDAQRATVKLWPKTGLPRSGILEGLEASVAFNSVYRVISSITWLETVTVITSLRLKASVAGGFKAGSVFALYKVAP